MSDPAAPVLSVRGLTKRFPIRKTLPFASLKVSLRPLRISITPPAFKTAVDDVTFEIPKGQTLALVGESGSGKSTVGLMLLGLLEPTSGEMTYEGKPFPKKRPQSLRRAMQVVFQDPYASLNARMTVRETLTEGMVVHRIGGNVRERNERAAQLLEQVGLSPGALERYPHEFSGGQRQRIAIARALSVGASFLVLDEPTSALDVSVQSQVLNLLRRLQRENGLTFLFITHNLGVVEYLADSVCVMEAGRIVERGSVEQIFDAPQQEYTKRLLSSIPSLDPDRRRLAAV